MSKKPTIKDRIKYWLWHSSLCYALSRKSPICVYWFETQKALIYDKVFKEKGFDGVIEAHKEYTKLLEARIRKRHEKNQDQNKEQRHSAGISQIH